MSPGAPSAIERTHTVTHVFGIAGIRSDRVDFGAGVSQVFGKLVEAVRVASDQGYCVTSDAEATSNRQSQTGSGSDQ